MAWVERVRIAFGEVCYPAQLYIGCCCLEIDQVDLLRSLNPTLALDCGTGL